MKTYVVLGTQWGDEGKGKIIDVLSPKSDYVVRYQGGNNAGHTVVIHDQKFVLHLLPSGMMSSPGKCIIGAGVVVDIDVLLKEIESLESRGKKVDNLFIDQRAHIIMPYHIALDKAKEEAMGEGKIGTTHRGVGPCYVDKVGRVGIRMGDLLEPQKFKEKLAWNVSEKNALLNHYGQTGFDVEEIFTHFMYLTNLIKHRIIDAVLEVNHAIEEDKVVLFEGAQATMLDVNFGTYPYVTSSSPTAGGVCTGAGVSPKKLNRILGVMKAYTTRVGEGPFPTELDNELGEKIRQTGGEFGATTGRPRKCGWLDLVVGRYAVLVNGLTDVVLTKIDILTGIDKLKIAVGYRYNGQIYSVYPGNLTKSTLVEVIYQELEGWTEDISEVKDYDQLPENCKKYIEFIENTLQCNVSMVSVGPERTQNIYRHSLLD